MDAAFTVYKLKAIASQHSVDCAKQSSGCNGGLMDAAPRSHSTKMNAIAFLSSSSLIDPSGAVAAMVVS